MIHIASSPFSHSSFKIVWKGTSMISNLEMSWSAVIDHGGSPHLFQSQKKTVMVMYWNHIVFKNHLSPFGKSATPCALNSPCLHCQANIPLVLKFDVGRSRDAVPAWPLQLSFWRQLLWSWVWAEMQDKHLIDSWYLLRCLDIFPVRLVWCKKSRISKERWILGYVFDK